MKVYRSAMEKKMDEMENETVVTNPEEPYRTLLRKLAYRWEVIKDRLRHPLGGGEGRGRR
jgi:hypothetical protein